VSPEDISSSDVGVHPRGCVWSREDIGGQGSVCPLGVCMAGRMAAVYRTPGRWECPVCDVYGWKDIGGSSALEGLYIAGRITGYRTRRLCPEGAVSSRKDVGHQGGESALRGSV
jgi:hypothetical protein